MKGFFPSYSVLDYKNVQVEAEQGLVINWSPSFFLFNCFSKHKFSSEWCSFIFTYVMMHRIIPKAKNQSIFLESMYGTTVFCCLYNTYTKTVIPSERHYLLQLFLRICFIFTFSFTVVRVLTSIFCNYKSTVNYQENNILHHFPQIVSKGKKGSSENSPISQLTL